tara:strand:+ start:4507 stop:7722 length:3216 start_codon:yes stop_codon:yes gene_type:complete
MADVYTASGQIYQPHGSQNIKENENTVYDNIVNFGRGFGDENLIAIGSKFIINTVYNDSPHYKVDNNYDPYYDPQLQPYKPFIGQFLHSKSKEHSTYLLDRFKTKMKAINGDPSYIIGRILGGILDPSSLFLFTKAGSIVIQGNRMKRMAAGGGLIGGEEAIKQGLTDERTTTEGALITAAGFIVPALFPNIPNGKSAKKFDKYADMYDRADDEVFNNAATVGAASPRGSKLKTEADYQDLNQIQPTGLGIFGEQGPFNPVFRVLKNGISEAQEMMETLLEGALFQKKNFKDIVTAPSIERKIKMRYAPLVIDTTKKMELAYNSYLVKMGESAQNFFDRAFNTKFNRSKGVMTPREFREKIFDYRMGQKYGSNEVFDDEVILASRAIDDFYKTIGKEYDSLKIVETSLTRQLNTLDTIIANTKNVKRKQEFILTRAKLQKRLDYVKENGSLIRNNYTNIVYKRDAIDADFEGFKKVLGEALRKSNKNIRQDEIDDIAEGFKQYQPVIAMPNITEEIAAMAKTGNVADINGFVEKINKISARFKNRTLNIDYRILANAGFIEKDVATLNKLYFNQTIPDIEITKVFGDPMGYGTSIAGGRNTQLGIQQISELYDEAISAAGGVNTKKGEKLQVQKNQILKDLDSSIHLLRGTYGLADDPNRNISRGIRLMKLYNSMTMLTGIAQVVDTARLVMINGMGKTMRISWDLMTSGYFKEIYKMNLKTTQLGGEAMDMFASTRAMAMYGIDDAFGVFNKFERGTSSIGNLYFTYLNLSNPWNTAVKNMASLFNGTRMIESIEKQILTGKITKVNKARLRNMGIDDAMGKRIYDQYKKYGYGKNARKWTSNGDTYKQLRVANTDEWTDKAAADAYHNAIGKQANIDIVTPSKGDVPLWANTEIGGVLTQFKKFGMASTQRMLMRGLQEKDANFFTGVLLLMAAGAGVDAFRQRAFNRDYSKKPFGQKIVDAFDRSGLGGIYSDINNAIERLGNNEIGLRPLLGAKKPYGTYRDVFNNPIPDVLGPTTSQLANIGDIMWTWGSGKYNHHTARNVRRLVPFQNVWFLDSLFDEMEKEVLR